MKNHFKKNKKKSDSRLVSVSIIGLAIVVMVIASCSGKDKVPKGILSPARMQAVMWDMVNAGEYLQGFVLTQDSVDRYAESAKVYSRVLQVHKLSLKDFEKSYLYYRQHPKLMSKIIDSLGRRQVDVPEAMPVEAPPSMISDEERKAADSIGQADSVDRPVVDSLKLRRDSLRNRIKKFKADP